MVADGGAAIATATATSLMMPVQPVDPLRQDPGPWALTVGQPEPERRATLAYVYEGLPARLGLVRGTRFQRLTQRAGGPTIYDTVEEFSGPLVPLAGPARVEAGFKRHAEALKARAESL